MEDTELVLSARRGSKDAFASIYERYSGGLYDFVYSVTRDPHEASDVLHDAFMVAGARLGQLRDPAKLRPWLYAIARHEALRSLKRKSKYEPWREGTDVISTEPGPSHTASQRELAELVWAAAGGLNPRDRVVLNLHLRQGLEGQELGEALGVSAGHASVLLNRLKGQVERSLGALLVARLGRKDCNVLSQLLTGWDGRFNARIRKQVVRHIEGCVKCSEVRRRTVSPVSLLSALPLFPPPKAVGEKLMEDIRLVSHKGRPWPANRGGFPPGLDEGRKKRGAGWAAAVVLLGGFLLSPAGAPLTQTMGGSADPPKLPLASGEKGAGAASAGEGAAPGEPLASGLLVAPVDDPEVQPVPADAPGQQQQDGGMGPAGAVQPQTGESNPTARFPAEYPPAQDPESRDGPQTADPDSEGTSPTAPSSPDTAGPSITGFSVEHDAIWAQGRCSGSGRGPPPPQTTRVELSAADPSGIISVVLKWGDPVPGSTPMRLGRDGLYAAVVGPFPESSMTGRPSVTVPLTATATDAAGNSSSATGSFVLRCESPR